MIFSLFFQIIISFIIIYIIHSLYLFFINNLTTPKIKDLVKKPQTEYDNIYKTINKENTETNVNENEMKEELKNYLSELSNKNNNENKQESFSFNNNSSNIGYTNI
jgi:predicted Holliday junction resolvase-like endonuclease